MPTARLSVILVAAFLAFAPNAAAEARLSVAIAAPRAGQQLSGAVTWKGKVGPGARRVVFAIDGKVSWSQRHAPFLYGGSANSLRTESLANGPHVLSTTAYGVGSVRGSSRITVTVSNPTRKAGTATAATGGPGSTKAGSTPSAPAGPAPAVSPVTESVAGTQPVPVSSVPIGGPIDEVPLPEVAPGDRKSIYWGATIGSQLTGTMPPWDMSGVTKFEELTRKPLTMIQFFQPFENCASSPCTFYAFPRTPLENIRAHGSIPVLSWASESIPWSVEEPDFQLADLIRGDYDSQIRAFATAAKQWGHPFLLRFDWEMNGSWFPWSESANGNRPGEYVTAWRHVHDIFTAVGATNATWVWCPNIDPTRYMGDLGSLYPGDDYVDWTGLDGYNWGTNPIKPDRWLSFDQIYSSTYRVITETVAPSKPMLIGEIGSSEYGGSKAEWIANTLERIPAAYPKIRAVLWFDKTDGGFDWPIESSGSAAAAFATGLRSSNYLGNSFTESAGAKIAPPG